MDMSRRSAILAAAAASMSANELVAYGQAPGEAKKLLLLRVVMPDGQTIEMKASEVVVDFGTAAKLSVTPSGVLPQNDQRSPTPLDRLDLPTVRSPHGTQPLRASGQIPAFETIEPTSR